MQAGDFAEAESHYRQALPGRPTAETHNGLGYVLARQGRADEAIAEFRKAIDIDPNFTPAYNNLADALAQQGKLEEAAEYYRRSLAEKPSAGRVQRPRRRPAQARQDGRGGGPVQQGEGAGSAR